ncbi:MAG: ATPase, T2SS/T4P/T4SS family [Verrucomicrobia bacterium]|nr:ATPase, T2SS/T4P/T4SS family [Verrucomicrobiota bacterium]
MKIEIYQSDAETTVSEITPGIYSIGRDDDCHIHLQDRAVSHRHAVLTVDESLSWIEDLSSENGTLIADRPVSGRAQLRPGQRVSIGPYELVLTLDDDAPDPKVMPLTSPEQEARSGALSLPPERPAVTRAVAYDVKPTASENQVVAQRQAIKKQIHKELVQRLDIKRLTASRIDEKELRALAIETVSTIVAEVGKRLPEGISAETLAKEICDEALRLGPIEDLLDDDSITEIMVNGPDRVYFERAGKLYRSDKTFMNEASVLAIIERIVSPLGRRIDESQPYVDARLPDGSRVNAIIHPLSLIGPCLTIRKFSKKPFQDTDLIRLNTLTREIADFLSICVRIRKNIVVSGGTGSGKTSLLNVLSGYLPHDERILTIEDAAELRLPQEHVVRLESRPANIEGRGAIPIRDLVRNSLRMRPDRVVVGECRGGEALDMLQAMNTGHDGSLTTVHANTPRDVISRLETMVLMSGMDLPVRAIREQIASAVDLIVHESRFSDGTRKVTHVTEIVGLEGNQITMQDIFEYVQTGIDSEGRVEGYFQPTGAVPTFVEEIASRGIKLDHSMFNPKA